MNPPLYSIHPLEGKQAVNMTLKLVKMVGDALWCLRNTQNGAASFNNAVLRMRNNIGETKIP